MKTAACIMLFSLFSHCLIIQQQKRYSLSGKIQLTEMNGTVYLSLIDRQHFDEPGSGLDSIMVEVSSDLIPYEFSDIPKGVYAIRCFQDKNGNRKLDKGIFGPKEPWALTWNGKKRFPPRFEDISFTLDGDMKIDLTLVK